MQPELLRPRHKHRAQVGERLGARVARLERGTHCTAVRSAYALLEELRDREVEEPQADARDHHSAHEGQQLHLVRVRATTTLGLGLGLGLEFGFGFGLGFVLVLGFGSG